MGRRLSNFVNGVKMALGRQVPNRPVIIELGGSNLPIGKSMPDLVLPHIRDQLYTSLGPYINPYPNDIFDCELISRHCPHLFATQVAIRNEVWRKEPTMKPNFAGKCLVCGEEHEDEVQACPTCGGLVRPPDPKEKRVWYDFKKVMNAQGQLPLDMCRQQQIDITRFDDAFYVYLYDYWVDDFGHILAQKVINVTRGTPGRILLVNDEYGIVGGQLRKSGGVGLYTCVLHREENLQMDNKRPCIKCGRTLVPVKWVEVNNQNRPVMGLLESEIFHWSHYQPTIDYGFAPPAALWTEASTLVNQTRLAATTYEQQRPAKGILVIATTDAEGMNSQFKQWDVELSVNPNYLCKLAYNPIEGMGAGGGVREPVKYIPLTQSMEELKFIDMRREFRQTIEAVYGVSDQTLSDTQSSGGLNQEGLKITVTLRTVEVHQETWHDKPFKDLFSKLGIMDWHLEFDPPVESDKDKPLGRRVQNLGLMDTLLKMGGEFDIDDPEDFHFKLTRPPTQASQTAMSPLGTPLPGVGGPKKNPTDILTLDLSKGCCGAEKAEERNRFLSHLEAAFREALGQMELPRIPIQAELMRAVKATLDRARQNWTTAVLQDYARLLEAGIRSVGHLEEVAVDLNALAAAQLRMSPMWSAYSGMTDDLAHDFNTLILEAIATPQEFDLRRLRKRMLARAREVAESRLDRIARTETQVLSNKGRELHYKVDDDGTQLYQFIHARTFRLCPACDKIMRLIGKGQPLEVCRRIVHEVTQAYMGPAWVVRDWSVHPNCLGALIRVSGLSKEALEALAKDNYVVTDRYDALGMAPPDPATMCHGQCEGTGFVPVHPDMVGDIDPRLVQLWDDAEAEDHSLDGWHFVVCPDCGGSGMSKAWNESEHPRDDEGQFTEGQGTPQGATPEAGVRIPGGEGDGGAAAEPGPTDDDWDKPPPPPPKPVDQSDAGYRQYITDLSQHAREYFPSRALTTDAGRCDVYMDSSYPDAEERIAQVAKSLERLPRSAIDELKAIEVYSKDQAYSFKVGDNNFKTGGHWSIGTRTIRIFGADDVDDVVAHEAGHAEWDAIERSGEYEDAEFDVKKQTPEHEAAKKAMWAEVDAADANRKTALKDFRDKHDQGLDNLRADSYDKERTWRDAKLDKLDQYDHERFMQVASAHLKATRAYNKALKEYNEGENAICLKYNANEIATAFEKKFKSPIVEAKWAFFDACKEEGGITPYCQVYIDTKSPTMGTECFAELSATYASEGLDATRYRQPAAIEGMYPKTVATYKKLRELYLARRKSEGGERA
jgi:hypothetical protein